MKIQSNSVITNMLEPAFFVRYNLEDLRSKLTSWDQKLQLYIFVTAVNLLWPSLTVVIIFKLNLKSEKVKLRGFVDKTYFFEKFVCFFSHVPIKDKIFRGKFVLVESECCQIFNCLSQSLYTSSKLGCLLFRK